MMRLVGSLSGFGQVGLRTYLLILLVPLVSLPLIVVGWLARDYLIQNTTLHLQGEAGNLLRITRKDLLAQFDTARANVDLFSGSQLVKDFVTTENERTRYGILQLPLLNLFSSYVSAYPDYDEIRILMPDGREDARVVRGSLENRTEDESRSPYFQRLREAGGDHSLQLFQNSDDDEWAFLVSRKLFFRSVGQDPSLEATFRGYLAVTIRADLLKEEIETTRIGSSGFLLVCDPGGRVLFAPSWVDLPPQLPAPLVARVTAAGVSEADFPEPIRTDLFTRPALIQGVSLPDSLTLVAVLWEDDLHAKSRPLEWVVAGITLTSILLVMLLSYVSVRRIVEPVIRLSRAARQVGSGSLDIQVHMGRIRELSSLAQSFNTMVADLKEARQDLTLSYEKIRRQNTELQELDRLKDDFLANVTHELKTPLNGILGLGRALQEGAYGAMADTLRRPVGQIVASADRLLRLTLQILTFARGKGAVARIEEIVLRPYLTAFIGQFEGQALERGIGIGSEVAPDLVLRTDPALLETILGNLVGNALKYTHQGWVRIFGESLEGEAVAIVVADTGIGIAPEFHEKIFERFQQGFASENRAYEGSGLGLAILKDA
ncbi:MAG: sensor histidine kinase, partial [Magnetococcales bacterium]|nr:sensor histidine kinase [Magnetococcales bacterium]